jgi:hypothetical protein
MARRIQPFGFATIGELQFSAMELAPQRSRLNLFHRVGQIGDQIP